MRIDWIKLEKIAIYTSFGAYVFFQVVSNFKGSIFKLLPDGLPLLFLSIAVVGAAHYLIRTIEESSGKKLITGTFPVAFQKWISSFDSISSLCITAYTSTLYYHSIHSSLIKINHLKLLLFVPDDKVRCSSTQFDLDETINNWISLKESKQIKKLEIRRIMAPTYFYFSVADSQKILLGTLWPKSSIKDLQTTDALVLSKDNSSKVIKHLEGWFESVWSEAENILPEPNN